MENGSHYERTSLIVTTNLPFENWTEVLGSERLTGATLDRLTHRCHILEARGDSHRLREAKRRRGQTKASPEETDQSNAAEEDTSTTPPLEDKVSAERSVFRPPRATLFLRPLQAIESGLDCSSVRCRLNACERATSSVVFVLNRGRVTRWVSWFVDLATGIPSHDRFSTITAIP